MCAWQPGQLDRELKGLPPFKAENSWLIADPNDTIVYDYDGDTQWEKALTYSRQQMINFFF
jgi:putative AlgH/UPF0301 family transcriptional regulator